MSSTVDSPKVSFHIEVNKLILGSGGIVTFKYPIKKVLDASNVVIVMLRPPIGVIFNENVYGVDYKGTILWQVPPQQHLDPESPYTDMSLTPDGHIGLYNWDAGFYIIEPLTGKIIAEKFAK